MNTDERDELIRFLVEKHEQVMADLSLLKDTQLQINAQIEKLTKVVFGLTQQLTEVAKRLEPEQKCDDQDWVLDWSSFPPRKS